MSELIYSHSLIYKEKSKEKKVKLEMRKMSKAIEENKLAVAIKIWEFNLYWIFMCLEENNDKDKTNLHPLTKLTFKFQWKPFCEKLSVTAED